MTLLELAEDLARAEQLVATLGICGQPSNLEDRVKADVRMRLATEALYRARKAYDNELRITQDSELKRLAGL